MTKTKRPQNEVIIGTAEKLVQQISSAWTKAPLGSDRKKLLHDEMDNATRLYNNLNNIYFPTPSETEQKWEHFDKTI